MTFRLAVAACVAAFAALDAPAATYYVNNVPGGGCADLGPGTQNVPFCTIQTGYDRAASGDEVRVLPGTYGECLFLGFDPLLASKNVTVVAEAWLNGGDNTVTIIDGALAGACAFPNTATASLVNVSGRGATGSAFRGFTVRGAVDTGIFGVGSVAITNNVVRDNASPRYGGGIYIYTLNCYYGATVTTIGGNLIKDNHADFGGGIQVTVGREDIVLDPNCTEEGDATLTIRDNVIADNTSTSHGGGVHATIFNNDVGASRVVITSNTITGNSAGSAEVYGYGGGVYGITYGFGAETIEIADNIIANNTCADLGGGISTVSLPPVWAENTTDHLVLIQNNSVTGNTGERGGGGLDLYVRAWSLSEPETVRMRAIGNSVTGNQVTIQALDRAPNFNGGGGISAQLHSLVSTSPNLELTVERNRVTHNSSTFYGGAASLRAVADGDVPDDYGGTIAPSSGRVTFIGNQVTQNRAAGGTTDAAGGGVFAYLEAEGEATSTIDFRLNTLAANTLGTAPAASYVEPAPARELPIRIEARRRPGNVAHARTTASFRTGGLHVESFTLPDSYGEEGLAALRVDSSIVAANGGLGIGGPLPGTPGIVTPGGSAELTVHVAYSDVFGNAGGGYDSWIGDRTGAAGNIAVDPVFADPAVDFHLGPGSPAIDAGDPALPPPVPDTDVDGDARVIDGDGDGIAVVDMGYDEAVLQSRVVAIDIKPGSSPNSVNPSSRGVVPVAVLGSADFDVTTLDVATLRFGPAEAAPAHDLLDPATYLDHLQDVDLDGDLDLVLHFRTTATGIACDDTEADLIGETTLGISVRGTDSIATTGCRAGDRAGPWSREERLSRPAAETTVDIAPR